MTYLPDTQDPAIRDALMLVQDALTEIEDQNLYERQGTTALDDAQYVLAANAMALLALAYGARAVWRWAR